MTKNSQKIQYIVYCVASILILAIMFSYNFLRMFFKDNTNLKDQVTYSLYIHSEDTFETVMNDLVQNSVLFDTASFRKVAMIEKYDKSIKTGRFLICHGMNNKEIISILSRGVQTPVKVIFNSSKSVEDIAGKVSTQIEADSASIKECFDNEHFLKTLGYTFDNRYDLLVPNTYEFYWNTTAEGFWKRMKLESEKFWNESRNNKAAEISLTKEEVITLASIVECETQKKSEKPKIAGVYINRLKKGMLLQACPTLIYISNYEGMRVKTSFKDIDSPYNTYMYKGLPPGPICIPSISSIDAVLNYEHHNYLFFCAKPDLSGYHDYSRSYSQHQKYANDYQRMLNERGIK